MKKKARSGYYLLYALLLGLSFYFYGGKIQSFPSEIHAWTESDRLALAVGFYENGHQLYLPQTLSLETENGVTAVDLPLVEWLVSFVMRMAGSSDPFWFRLFHLLISLLGFGFLYAWLLRWTASVFRSILAVLFVFITPVIMYYQAGFLPSLPCLSLLWIGYYFYFKYIEKRDSNTDLYWTIAFIGLAALIRKTYVIFLVAVFCQEFLFWLRTRKIEPKALVAFLGMATLFVGYFLYNQYLTEVYGSRFLNTLCPPANWSEFWLSTMTIFGKWSAQLMSFAQYLLLGVGLLLAFTLTVKNKWEVFDWQVWTHIGILSLGVLSFFVAMQRQFFDHEYYFIDSFYPLLFLLFFWALSKLSFDKKYWNTTFRCLGAALLLLGAYQAKVIQKEKDAPLHWKRLTKVIKDFEGSKELLKELNISKESKVLVLEAYASNATLLLLERKGYALRSNRKEKIQKALTLDVDYIAVSDMYFTSDILVTYPSILGTLERVGGNGKVSIYRKIKRKEALSLEAALGIGEHILIRDSLILSSKNIGVDWRNIQVDSTMLGATFVNSQQEYGLTYSKVFQADELSRVLLEGQFKSKANCIAILSFFVKKGAETLHYWEFPMEAYQQDLSDWLPMQFLFDIPESVDGEIRIDCFLWNRNRCEIYSKEIVVTAIGPK